MVMTSDPPIALLATVAKWRRRGLSAACLLDMACLVLMEEPGLSPEIRAEIFAAFRDAIDAVRGPGERPLVRAS